MMMSPEMFRKENENLSIEELVNNRNKLLEEIHNYENRKILNKTDEIMSEDMVKPSPATAYYWHNFYLKEITDLIISKSRQ